MRRVAIVLVAAALWTQASLAREPVPGQEIPVGEEIAVERGMAVEADNAFEEQAVVISVRTINSGSLFIVAFRQCAAATTRNSPRSEAAELPPIHTWNSPGSRISVLSRP